MPGMSSGLNANNPTIVAAFQSLLYHQGIVALVVLVVMAAAWRALRMLELRRALSGAPGPAEPWPGASALTTEAPGRRLLRVGFGLLWVLDGILQAQPDMPLGMTTGVMQPAAASSPTWVQHVANAGATVWSFHPVEAPASAVWIQVGIGLWLLVATRGTWSRLAGVAAAIWGTVVWVFGEAFGGLFAPGLSWLYGAPGAALAYALAGVLVALPEEWWAGRRLPRALLRALGSFLVGMALLQAWPERGFWEGHLPHSALPGSLASMSHRMALTPQPSVLSGWVSAFAGFDEAHGFAVNFFVVTCLALTGAALVVGRRRALRYAVLGYWALSLADWVLVQDLGFLGGVGTDPNSMVPLALLVTAAYLGVTRLPAPGGATATVVPLARAQSLGARLGGWRLALSRHPGYFLRSVLALGSVGIVLLGAVPMALASAQPNADPIIAQALNGVPNVTDFPARTFALVDQYGRPVSLRSLRGSTVALTFLDPVCTNDCPLIARYFRQADKLLSPALRRRVEMVAIVANPVYRTGYYVREFDRQEGMQHLANWLYLTGPLPALQKAWAAYGIQVSYEPGGAMIGHSELAFVIDARGRVRSVLEASPGSGTQAQTSSLAFELAGALRTAARGH